MKIAIASMDKDENSSVSEVAGRSPYFLIFQDDKLVEAVKNPFLYSPGAGFAVGNLLANKGVEIFVAGRLGPNLISNLQQQGIKVMMFQGTVKEALDKILSQKQE